MTSDDPVFPPTTLDREETWIHSHCSFQSRQELHPKKADHHSRKRKERHLGVLRKTLTQRGGLMFFKTKTGAGGGAGNGPVM